MGYACPVCGDPQADGEHLANHLAFTAMLGDDDHEAWLDDHAPDWADSDPGELAAIATDHAEEREFPQVFEDTTRDHGGHGHDHAHGHGQGGHDHGHDQGGQGPDIPADVAPDGMGDPADLDDGDTDPSDVLAEARELTRQRRAGGTEGDDEETDASDDEAAGDGE